MTDHDATPAWKRLLATPLAQVFELVLAVVAGCVLVMWVVEGGLDAPRVTGALEWARVIVGMVALLAGGREATRAFRDGAKTPSGHVEITPGLLGALVGATLLDVGGWAAPAALGVFGLMHYATQIAALRAGTTKETS
jgi:hypothetical protein